MSTRLAAALSAAVPSDSFVVWAFLRYSAPPGGPSLSPRAVERRARRAPLSLGEPLDAPLDPADVRTLSDAGLRVRVASRWLRAVSGVARAHDIARIGALPCVLRLDLVGTRRAAPRRFETSSAQDGAHAAGGITRTQLAQVRIDSLHALGWTGEGVLIGMLDTGFTRRHAALQEADVLASRDVINGDAIVENETGQDDPRQDDHGTQTWGIIAGDTPGTYCGGAPRASFALAKTEELLLEERAEEDFWVAGIEWADSLGVDVVSSSLGYNFVGSDSPYVYADLDGDTAPATIAADAAAARGIVVVSAAGNEGGTAWRYVMVPADADSALAVGAVDSLGARASFSSVGPTADGRIKPDLVAMGVRTAVINPNDSLGYGFGGGTSFAAPLVASLCALLLQAHPDWSSGDVCDALRATASQANAPDTSRGWGIPHGVAALAYSPSHVTDDGGMEDRGLRFARIAPQPAGGIVALALLCDRECDITVRVFDLLGRRVADVAPTGVLAGVGARWEGRWDTRSVPAGLYLVRATAGDRAVTRRVAVAR